MSALQLLEGCPLRKWTQRVNAVLFFLWIGITILSIASGLIYSIAFISAVSLYNIILSHGAWWQGAKAEKEAAK